MSDHVPSAANEHHWWGLHPSDSAKTAWGARAIWDGKRIDLVWDRMSSRGDPEELSRLTGWIDGGALARLEAILRAQGIGTDSRTEVRLEDGGFVLRADARGSYGYLYLVAHPAP